MMKNIRFYRIKPDIACRMWDKIFMDLYDL